MKSDNSIPLGITGAERYLKFVDLEAECEQPIVDNLMSLLMLKQLVDQAIERQSVFQSNFKTKIFENLFQLWLLVMT